MNQGRVWEWDFYWVFIEIKKRNVGGRWWGGAERFR